MKTSLLIFGALLALAGCSSLNQPYEERSVTDVLNTAAVAGDTRPDALPVVTIAPDMRVDAWWSRFGDEVLTRLITKAYAANRTLEAARSNLRAARAAWEYQQGALLPMVDGGGDIMRHRTSDNGLSGRNRYTSYGLSGTARWELDLFGRQQFLIDAAEAEMEATEANLKAIWISVSSAVANAYLELRTLQGRLMVAEDNLKLQQANYELQADRNAGGLTNELVKNQAEYDLRTTAASIPNLKARIVAVENTIAILCGVTPGTLPPEIVTVRQDEAENGEDVEADSEAKRPAGLRPTRIPQPEAIPLDMGISVSAIRRRPDVIASERLLKAAVERLGSAKAERYPNFYISASLGVDSLKLGDLLDWDSHFYNFGPGFTVPIFRGGQIRANIEIKTEEQRIAVAEYEHTVLTALGDIRTAYAAYVQEQQRLLQLRQGVLAAQAAYEIASNKYNAGLGDFFDVLDAQRKLFSLDEDRVICEGTIAAAQVALYKAICGGWEGEAGEENAEQLFGVDKAVEPLLEPLADHIQ
ncbi:MAG: TolC family protein [Kiritimatiellae bacterium]|nr:TolC family protein [Kiritimatiellia bacterium]